jgi:hypothetical protein
VDQNDAGLAWDILARYTDPATAEFDTVLAAAQLPPEVTRALRFWQRESVANVKQFASEALPAVFSAIYAAQRDAADATRKAGAALGAGATPRTPGHVVWEQPPAGTITMPDVPAPDRPNVGGLEERRRTVAARLAELG